MEYYTYIYNDPLRQEPFYVGKGKDNRCEIHLKKSHNKQVNGRIKNLANQNIRPDIERIGCTNEHAAGWVERVLIAAFGREDLRTGCLLNHTDGGEGGNTLSSHPRKNEIMTALHEAAKSPASLSKRSISARGQNASNYKHGKFSGQQRSGKYVSVMERTGINLSFQKKPIVTCPHCGKVGGGGAMKQSHFDKCKKIRGI